MLRVGVAPVFFFTCPVFKVENLTVFSFLSFFVLSPFPRSEESKQTQNDKVLRGKQRRLLRQKFLQYPHITANFRLVSTCCLLSLNCFAPHGEAVVDGFGWREAQTRFNLSSRVAHKEAGGARREACRFGSA